MLFSDQQDKQKASEVSTPEQTDASQDEICKSRASDGVVQIALNDSSVDTDFTKKQDDINVKDEPQQLDNAINIDLDTRTDEKTGRLLKAVNQKEKESSTKEAKPSAVSATKATDVINTSKPKLTNESGKKIASPSKAKPTVPSTEKNTSDSKTTTRSENSTSLGDNRKVSCYPVSFEYLHILPCPCAVTYVL